MKKLLVIGVAIAGLMLSLNIQMQAQGGTPRISPADGARPAPRLHDGTIDLTGPWVGGGTNNDFEEDAGMKPGELDKLLLPWARDLRADRRTRIQDEPYTACLPQGVPRVNPYPWKFVNGYTAAGLTHVYVLFETGGGGSYRQIFMDGRKHPTAEDLYPSWFGHSIGRFEKDTLVIDTIGYNDKFWFDATGTPHTEQLHTIERWTRINFGTMINDFTLDDPGAFARPLQLKFTATHIRPGLDLMEFICLEDNQYGIAGGFTPAREGAQ